MFIFDKTINAQNISPETLRKVFFITSKDGKVLDAKDTFVKIKLFNF